MLKKLKKIVEKQGITEVTLKLGYRSNSTIYIWFKNNKIPKIAQPQVKKFLKGK